MLTTLRRRTLFAAAMMFPGALTTAPHRAAPEPWSKTAFHDAMRKLWTDHVTWTRLYIVSAVGGLPDAKATTDRLLQNQVDIGTAMADFYGKPAGDQLTALLRTHILTAAELVGAAKAGDAARTADAKKRWYDNADEIAVFLAKANPKQWTEAAMKLAMKTHLDQTLDEATHRIKGAYDEDVKDYDKIVTHILTMADLLSAGIEEQFPEKFSQKTE